MSIHNLCFEQKYENYQNFSSVNFHFLVVKISVYLNRHVFLMMVCLFVLRFYGPVNPMGSCRARSVYLTTRLLGRFSPLSG